MPFEIFAYTVKFCKPSFGKTPKTFYTVDVSAAMCKFVLSVINPKMLAITHINQSAISTSTIRIDDAVQANFTQYNVLQGLLFTIRNDFHINPALTFEYTEYRLFQRSSAAFEFAMKASLLLGAKITFIDFYASIELFLKFTLMAIDFLTKDVVPMIDGIVIKTGQQSGF